MKFLVISYSFGTSAAGIMTKRVVEELLREGHNVHIIAADCICDSCCEIHNCPPLISSQSIIYRLFRRIHRLFFNDLEQYHFFWRQKAYQLGVQLTKKEHFDYIYARSSPVDANIVGYKISQKTDIPIIQHFTDPYPTSLMTKNTFIRSLQKRVIKRVLDNANVVSYGNKFMMEQSLNIVGITKDQRFYVSPDVNNGRGFREINKPSSEVKTLLFLGGVGGLRNPKPLFDAVGLLNDEGLQVELHLYTEKSVFLKDLPTSIIFEGRKESIDDALINADICVDLDVNNSGSPYISSKLKDYLSINRPILSITSKNSATREFLNEFKTVKIVENEVQSIKNALVFLLQLDNTTIDYSEREIINEHLSPRFVTEQLLSRI